MCIRDRTLPIDITALMLQPPKEELHDFYIKYEMNSFAKNTRKKEEVTRDGTYAVVQKISEAFYDGHSVVYAAVSYTHLDVYKRQRFGFRYP